MSGCCGYALDMNIDDVGFISQMIDETGKRVNVDPRHIYATGHSNGGAMSYRLACQISDKIAAVAAASPAGLEENCSPLRPVSVMHIHGTADPCVPYNGGQGGCIAKGIDFPSVRDEVDFWRKVDTCNATGTIVYQKGNATCIHYTCNQGTEVELCTVNGMGHAWPGGSPAIPDMVGPVSYDLSFDQIWEFFQRNPMP